MRAGRSRATVSLVDCLTRAPGTSCLHVLGARRQDHAGRSVLDTPAQWHAATRARLRRRKSAFGFHLIAADSRPETEDPVHPGHRRSCTGSARRCRRPASTTRNVQKCIAQVSGGGLGADLLADQPVLRRCAAAADGVRGRRHALHHREHHRAAAHAWSFRASSSCAKKARPARPR